MDNYIELLTGWREYTWVSDLLNWKYMKPNYLFKIYYSGLLS